MADDFSIPTVSDDRVGRIAFDFLRAWTGGEQPRLEHFLARASGSNVQLDTLFEALLRVELNALHSPHVRAMENLYCDRFPEYRSLIHAVIADRARDAESESWTQTHNDSPPADHELPRRIGRYEVQRELGRGSFGVVYLAYDPDLDCPVAIKKVSLERVAEAAEGAEVSPRDTLERLLQEARFAARLRQYPGIAPILDVMTTTAGGAVTELCFVQQYIDGGDLKQVVRRGPLAPAQAADLLRQVAQAVGHAHALGIYHRDLKPGNIILDSRQRPFVADFGLAVDERLQKQHRGEISGTLAYMSPEQTRGEAHLLDGRSDIWALGVILYELLTGQRPFRGDSRGDLFEEICRRDPRPPRMLNPQLPLELERIILKCLSKPIAGRYSTAFDLADDLSNWRDAQENAAAVLPPRAVDAPRPEERSGRRRHWQTVARVSVCALLVAAAVFLALNRPRLDDRYVPSVPYPLLAREPKAVVFPAATDQRMRPVHAIFDAERQSLSIQAPDLCFYVLGDAPDGRFLFETKMSKPVHEGVCGVFFGLAADPIDEGRSWSCHAILLISYHRGVDEPVSRLERHRLRFERIDQRLHLVEDEAVCQTPVTPMGDGARLLEVRVRDERVEMIRWNGEELRSLVMGLRDGGDDSWTCRGQFGVACFRGAVEFTQATLLLE